MILDIISTSCAYVLSLLQPQAARDSASCETAPGSSTLHLPMGLSSRSQLYLLASHRMELTRECKIPNPFAHEIKIFSIFAWLVPSDSYVGPKA